MKREVKIGIFAVLMIGCAWAGIRFLSGIDIFRRNSEYYAAYDRINGVQAASPVIMQGVKVGTVTGIRFDPRRSDKVVLQLTIKRQYALPADSEAQIVRTASWVPRLSRSAWANRRRCCAAATRSVRAATAI